jgi:hypothetical protein
MPRPLGYDDKTKEAALKLYLEGNGFRRIGRLLSVNHQSVVDWFDAFHTKLRAKKQALPVPGRVSTLEMDELFTLSYAGGARIPRCTTRARLTRSKATTPSYGTTWRAWSESLATFQNAVTRCAEP